MNGPSTELRPQPLRQKGALIEFFQRLVTSVPHIIVFQYNPETLTPHAHAVATGYTGGGKV